MTRAWSLAMMAFTPPLRFAALAVAPPPRGLVVDGARAPEHDLTCTTGGRATLSAALQSGITHTVTRSRRNGRRQEDGTMVTLRRVGFA